MDDQLGKARVRGLRPDTRPGADTPVAQNNTSKFNIFWWFQQRKIKASTNYELVLLNCLAKLSCETVLLNCLPKLN